MYGSAVIGATSNHRWTCSIDTAGANGRNASRILTIALMRSRISGFDRDPPGCCGCPSARGPYSIRPAIPRDHSSFVQSCFAACRAGLFKAGEARDLDRIREALQRRFDARCWMARAEKGNRQPQVADLAVAATRDAAPRPAQRHHRRQRAARKLRRTAPNASACRWPCSSARRRRPSPCCASRCCAPKCPQICSTARSRHPCSAAATSRWSCVISSSGSRGGIRFARNASRASPDSSRALRACGSGARIGMRTVPSARHSSICSKNAFGIARDLRTAPVP